MSPRCFRIRWICQPRLSSGEGHDGDNRGRGRGTSQIRVIWMSISCICLSGFAPLPDRASTGLPGPLQGSSEIMRSYVCGELAFIPLEFPRAEALKWPPNLLQNYLPSQDGMTHNQFIKVMIIFSIAFITVLILKVSGPRPTAQGGVMGLCCSSASC